MNKKDLTNKSTNVNILALMIKNLFVALKNVATNFVFLNKSFNRVHINMQVNVLRSKRRKIFFKRMIMC